MEVHVQDVTSFHFRHGLGNFRSARRNPVRVPLKLPSTKAPATTLRTTGRVTASKGIRNTQGVSYIYSSLETKISKSTPSIANVPKGTALKFKITALIKENDNTSATFDTTQWPATAVSARNVCVSHNNGVNITRPTPSEASNVKISGNDNIANYSGRHKSQNHYKTRHSDEAGIQKIQEFLEDNCCFSASFDKETEEFIFENPTKESMKLDQALNTLETTLMSISMTAEVVSLALLAVIRYVRKLKRATVENLWL